MKRSDGKGGFDNNAEIDLAPHHRIKRDLSGLQVREAGVESVFFEDTFVLGDNEEHGDIFRTTPLYGLAIGGRAVFRSATD